MGGMTILGIGSFVIYKAVQNNKNKELSYKKKPAESKEPNQTSPPQADLPVPSREEELEKYLLEKRLDLKKYFVFNLGKEVKTWEQKKTLDRKDTNVRAASGKLIDHLTKAAASCQKHLEQKGYGIKEGRFRKELICFSGENDWIGDSLDKKISEGNEYYIAFKKIDEDEPTTWFQTSVDENGKQWLHWTNAVNVKTDFFFLNKKEVLEFLTINDPALKWVLEK